MAAVDLEAWHKLNANFLGDFDAGIEMHPPSLYKYDEIYRVEVSGWEELKEKKAEMLQQLEDKGCIIVRQAFSPEEVQQCILGLNDLLDGNNVAFNEAREATRHNMKDNGDGGCLNTILQFEKNARENFASMTVEERRLCARKLHGFARFDQRFAPMYQKPELTQFIREILGLSEPPELWQDMVLFKSPGVGREKPWHQDNAYFNVNKDSRLIGTWTALDNATPENGCMHIAVGGHKENGQIKHWPHFQKRDWQVCDADVEAMRSQLRCKIAAVALKPGDMMIFTGMLPHGTPHNTSNDRRWAIQFHYTTAGLPRVPSSVRLGIYGAEGHGAVC